MKLVNTSYIECPFCGAQYTQQEIFVPITSLSYQQPIRDDETHKFTDSENMQSEQVETYTCDFCSNKFKIIMTSSYTTFSDDKINVSRPYKTKLDFSQMLLSED